MEEIYRARDEEQGCRAFVFVWTLHLPSLETLWTHCLEDFKGGFII
jgi:hypothetical protein